MALAGNGRWCYLDPKLGAMHAVAEAARKVACTGATPVAATNCLNFGSPEKPEIMAQLSAAIDGIAEACTTLGTPITGGNVSLYNETKGVGIYPTPVVGVVGIIDDVTKAVPSAFQRAGDDVLFLFFRKNTYGIHGTPPNDPGGFGSSTFANSVLQTMWGGPPALSLEDESNLQQCLLALAQESLLSSASDVSDGGPFVALARASFSNGIGIYADQPTHGMNEDYEEFHPTALWLESSSMAVVSCDPANTERVIKIANALGAVDGAYKVGVTVNERFKIEPFFDTTVSDLRAAYSGALESQLAAEVIG